MGKVFLNKQFSSYLGEDRAILDTVERYVSDMVTPTPTPSVTPTFTPTPTPTTTPTPTPSGVPVFTEGSGFDFRADCIVYDNGTNSLFVGGQFMFYNGTTSRYITKMSVDGVIDPTFSSGFSTYVGTVGVLVICVDGGYIWIGGNFNQTWGATNVTRLAKIDTTTGALAPGWVGGTTAGGTVNTIAVDGTQVVIGGSFTNYQGVTRTRIARVNSDGSLDSTITFGSGINATPTKILVNNAGNYVVVGPFTTFNGATVNRITEIDRTTGTDTGLFGTGFNGNDVSDIAYDSVNDLYYVVTNDTVSYQGGLARQIHVINGSGNEINAANTLLGVVPRTIYIDVPNDHLYVGRPSLTVQWNRASLSTLANDTTWNNNMIGINGSAISNGGQSTLVHNNKVYMVGSFSSFYNINFNRIVRANINGTNNSQ